MENQTVDFFTVSKFKQVVFKNTLLGWVKYLLLMNYDANVRKKQR